MKLTAILLFAACITASANGFSQKVTISEKNIPLEKVFKEIKKQTGYVFFYDEAWMKQARRVSLNVMDSPLEDVLKLCFKNQSLTFSIVGTTVVLTQSIAPIPAKNNEEVQRPAPPPVTITGKITDPDGNPLEGVSVVLKSTNRGVTTKKDGTFSIQVPDGGDALIISYVGFEDIQLIVRKSGVQNITMRQKEAIVDEIVVIGYGTSRKKDLTSAVSVIDVTEMKTGQTPRFEQMLTGRAAGVDISSNDASPGVGLKVRIRGSNSINGNNSPLLVVDGVLGGSFESLNVNDIQSLQVLKDASATAIYGSQGANGVIIVETKRGKRGEKLAVDVVVNSGFQEVRKRFDLLTAEEHVQILKNDPNFGFPSGINGITNPILTGKGTDWQDEIFRRARYDNYHINATGGSEKLRGFLSLDYLNQDGVVIGSGYTRVSGRSNVTYTASDKFSISHNLSTYRAVSNQVRKNSDFGSFGGPVTSNVLYYSPIVPVFKEDGVTYNGPLSINQVMDNPVALSNKLENVFENNYVQNTILTNWRLSKRLTHDFSANYTNTTNNNRRYTDKVLLRSLNLGEALLNNVEGDSWQIKNLLTYKKLFNKDHNFSALFGNEVIHENRFRYQVTAQGFATQLGGFNNIGIANNVSGILSDNTKFGLVSFFSRLTYGYKSKYLFSLSARADGATKFAKNNKWGYFPSGSFAWVISEESFLKDNRVINSLKFRTSYGKTGSQAINPYQSLANYQTGLRYNNGSLDVTNGAFINRVANPNLKWETTAQYDIGVDLELFSGRFGITADYYNKTTSDLLFDRRLPAFTGITSQIQNIGELRNQGYELGVNAQILDKAFKWDASANISLIKNKVVSLGGDNELYLRSPSGSLGSGFNTTGVLRVGQPIGNFFGYIADGIFKTQQDINAITQPGAILGTVRYKDISGASGKPDGKIDSYDRTIIGNALPDYTFGMTNNISFKNFELNITLQGAMGQDVTMFDKGRILTREKLEAWNPANPNRNVAINGSLGTESNSNYVEDASFVKFKNISFGYTLPANQVKKLGLKSLKLYASAIDALVFTRYSGYDPEVSSFSDGNTYEQNVALGYDSGAYPGVRQFMLGLNISF